MISPEFELLLLSCRLDDAGEVVAEAREIIENNQVNWEDLYARADFHYIKPQLWNLLKKLPSSFIAADFHEKLREAIQDNMLRQLRYVAEFFQIREWLETEGIIVIPYKGFILGETMYGNLGARESYDIDLFIDVSDLERIKAIMAGKGYRLHETLAELTDEYIFRELAEYNFDRYEEEVCMAHVEFHWRSSMSFYGMGIGMNDLSSQVVTGIIQGKEIKIFSPAANLLLAVMHHGGKECFYQLKQVLDIAQILKCHPGMDTEWLFRQTKRFHMNSLLMLGVRLASELTGVPVPTAFQESVKRKHIARMAEGRIRLTTRPVNELKNYKESLASWVFKIRSRDGLAMKADLCRYTLRKVVAPRMVPGRWRHHFFNRSIRKNPATLNGV